MAPTRAVDDPDPDLLVGELLQGLALTASAEPCTSALTMMVSSFISPSWIWANRFSRVTLLHEALAAFLLLVLALLHQLPGHALVGHGVEVVARAGHLGQAGDLHRDGGTGLA